MNRKRMVFTSLCMALLMSFFMSLVMTAANAGLDERFLTIWPRSWLIGFIVALPLAFILPPTIQRLAGRMGL